MSTVPQLKKKKTQLAKMEESLELRIYHFVTIIV